MHHQGTKGIIVSVLITENKTKTNGEEHLILPPLSRGDYPYHATDIKLITVSQKGHGDKRPPTKLLHYIQTTILPSI